MLALYRDVRLPPRLYRDDEARLLPPVMAAMVRKYAKVPEEKWTAYRTHFDAQVSEFDRQADASALPWSGWACSTTR